MDDWYVDDRCTNCDVARQLAPELISEVGGRSEVVRQPRDEAETRRLHTAVFACPTRSIRPASGRPDRALDPFPMALDDGVLICGHNSQHTAGANSYLLPRPSGTAMMIDTPRWSRELAGRYAASGPVTDVLLTHRDHAAHGRRYADHFGARLWIHEGDLDAAPDADQVIRGLEPVEIGPGVIAHPLPGHTLGSVLYLADDRYCFSGDSIYWSRALGDLAVAESVTWHSIEELAASLARVAGRLRFEWILPGHGDRRRLDADEMSRRLRALTERTGLLRPRPIDFTAVRW
ncbi:4Fe-4S domain-containing protein [Streptomyces rapamycinicus]|uniref:Beta-lactamase n=2 Tax=Streptomyces rapamycinicus TaxID=1226757 RepID=A0A0A0NNS7_STRRN|nr:ferredoxin [Streptomyces rapamycinicus]AGP58846.1 beta-lactamase [Streptomyces rapamycinicus NRRL 5491]MBB4786567.1 glyoxylase-like metal-dependent hydrolase (beta-lactamase superfamily II)/ferredoxin [Streptomyces rapamycinicus]RLV77974.1 beta-lactamase [Streptomyces rapamycinicus NRRL 5491]UTO66649.1 ferredoxin [Streptomyces rapamycinicus]UTP34602.1 ferredoxin [Streptomyces rapamycinicus NRRL 5491]